MNTNMELVDNEESALQFLRKLLLQVSQYNTIDIDNLKLLCYIIYKERTSEFKQKEINYLVTTILSYINYETQVYKPLFNNCETDLGVILNTYINNDLKKIYKE